jgi:hypothetical protein
MIAAPPGDCAGNLPVLRSSIGLPAHVAERADANAAFGVETMASRLL